MSVVIIPLLAVALPPPRVLYRTVTPFGSEFRIGQGRAKPGDETVLRVAKRYNGLKAYRLSYDAARRVGWIWFYEDGGYGSQTAWLSAEGRPLRVEKGTKSDPEFSPTRSGVLALVSNGTGGAVYVAGRARPIKLLTLPLTDSPWWHAAVDVVPGGWLFSSPLVKKTCLLRVGHAAVNAGQEVQALSLTAGYAVVGKTFTKPRIVRCRYSGGRLRLGEQVGTAPDEVSSWGWLGNRYLIGDAFAPDGNQMRAMVWDSRTRLWAALDEGGKPGGTFPWSPHTVGGRLLLTRGSVKLPWVLQIGEVDLSRLRFGSVAGLFDRLQSPPLSRVTEFAGSYYYAEPLGSDF